VRVAVSHGAEYGVHAEVHQYHPVLQRGGGGPVRVRDGSAEGGEGEEGEGEGGEHGELGVERVEEGGEV
jgi:hypothetical protein